MKEYCHSLKWNIVICSNMDGPRDYQTKWSQSDRERQIPYDFVYMWNLKILYKWTSLQNLNRLIGLENELMITSEKEWGRRDKLGVWGWYIHSTIFKIVNKDLLYSTGSSAQCSVTS